MRSKILSEILWAGSGGWGGVGGCGVLGPRPISLKLYPHMPSRVVSTCMKFQKMPHLYWEVTTFFSAQNFILKSISHSAPCIANDIVGII